MSTADLPPAPPLRWRQGFQRAAQAARAAVASIPERIVQVRRFADSVAAKLDRPVPDGWSIVLSGLGLAAPLLLARGVDTALAGDTARGLSAALAIAGFVVVEAGVRLGRAWTDAAAVYRGQTTPRRLDAGVAAVALGLLLGWHAPAALAAFAIAVAAAVLIVSLGDMAAAAARDAEAARAGARAELDAPLRLPGPVKSAGLEMAFARHVEDRDATGLPARIDAIAARARQITIAGGARDAALAAAGLLALGAAARGDISLGQAAACAILAARLCDPLLHLAMRPAPQAPGQRPAHEGHAP